jgi:hypothetical protein
MEDTNWELIQFKHEVLGYSLEELAREHSLSLPVLNFNAKDWKQLPLAKEKLSLQDISSFEEIIEKLGDQTESHTKAFTILKQKFLGPKYVELETVLLHKAIKLALNINESDPLGSRTLQSLTNVLSNLLSHNPLVSGVTDQNEGGFGTQREWKITVVDSKKKDEID